MEVAVLALALLMLATALAGVGVAGLTERLPRNRWIGLRIASLRTDDEAWRIGHRASGATLVTAAGTPLLLGVALLVSPPALVADCLPAYAVVGVVTGGLIALAARQAERAVAGPEEGDRSNQEGDRTAEEDR